MRDNLLDGTFVVIDLEATGFDVEKSEVIDIAAVRVEGGIITEKFSTLVYPGYFIPERIKKLTGITNAMLVGQPTIREILPEFLEFIGDNIVVGHFVEQDIKFINKYTKQYRGERFRNLSLCTLKLARRVFPGLKKYSLKELAENFGLETNGVHRALKDATLTAEVFLKILEELWFKYGIGDYYSLKRLEKGKF